MSATTPSATPSPALQVAPPNDVLRHTATQRALQRITAKLPGGGEDRPGQAQMAQAVADAVSARRHLVVQAGTGTGKSLAYLVPAILGGRRVVVATATKALQDQLAAKDLPFLAEHLDRPFEWAVLKGRSNYLCRQRLGESLDDGQLALEGTGPRPRSDELARISAWSESSATGDRADLPFEPSPATWAAVSVGARECPGAARCPKGDDCFAESARRVAATADVVVVNAHLYGLDLATHGALLPEHDVVVIDEAHHLEDTVSATSGVELAAGRFSALSRTISALVADEPTTDRLDAAADALGAALAEHAGRRLRGALPPDLATAVVGGRGAIESAVAAVRAVDSTAADTPTRKARALTAAGALADDLDAVMEARTGEVAWVEGEGERARLRVAPVDVGATLRELLWEPHGWADLDPDAQRRGREDLDGHSPDDVSDGRGVSDDDDDDNDNDDGDGDGDGDGDDHGEGMRRPPTVILTSATIPPLLPHRLGLPDGTYDQLDAGSPFDFAANATLYCAAHLPDPRSERWAPAAHDELVHLIEAAGGRTLALFTSRRSMNEAADAVAPRVDHPVLRQDELPKPALLARFTDDHAACLFATVGFFEGIDVPGPSLSLVTIDRVPFPRPDDPLLQARREAARADGFRMVDLSRAATLLAQGAGRLIRSSADCGVVAVLDPRLAKAGYRWELVSALPPMRRTKDRHEVAAILRRLTS